jgi:hypothetical protein
MAIVGDIENYDANYPSRKIVRDSSGNLFVVTGDNGAVDIYKSTDGGSTWVAQDTSNNPTFGGNVGAISIAIDSSDVIHVGIWHNIAGGSGFFYYTFSGSSWSDPADPSGLGSGLANNHLNLSIDSNDRLHLLWVYADDLDGANYLMYKNNVGGSWNTTVQIAILGIVNVTGIDLAINSSNVPEAVVNSNDDIIAYQGNANNATSFTAHTVDTSPYSASTASGPSIVTSNDGTTYIAYLDEPSPDSNIVTVAIHPSGTWTSGWSTVTNGNDGGHISAVVLGDTLYVVYTDGSSDVKYDAYDGSTWLGETNVATGTFDWTNAAWSHYHNNATQGLFIVYADGTDTHFSSVLLSQTLSTDLFEATFEEAVANYTVSHGTSAVKGARFTRTHTTDANKRKVNTASHTTDSLLRKQQTVSHTTDANLKKATTRTHTTDANKKKANLTVSHTTSSNNKKADNTVTHTTDALKRKQFTVPHSTDSFLRKQQTLTHSTDSFLRGQNTISHTTDSLKRKATLVSHTTDSNKKKANNTVSHTTDSNKRKITTISHTTDSNLVPSENLDQFQPTHHFNLAFGSESVKKIGQVFTPSISGRLEKIITTIGNGFESTDEVVVKIHTDEFGEPGTLLATSTNSFDGSTHAWTDPDITFEFTFDLSLIIESASQYWAVFERTGTLDGDDTYILKQANDDLYTDGDTMYLDDTDTWSDLGNDIQFYQYVVVPITDTESHTTDALKRKANTLTHSTDSFLRKQQTASHTTDSNKKKADNVVIHTTDSLKRTQNTVSHTTDANLDIGVSTETITHTTDSFLRIQDTVNHTTDSLLRQQLTVSHSTDSNKKKANNTLVHTTDSNKKKSGTVSHSTDANKKISGITLAHTTDSLLREQHTASHSTDSLKRTVNTVSHSTDSFLRKAFTVTHTTDTNKKRAQSVNHSTDANKKKAQSVSHTTDSLTRKEFNVSHSTDSLLREQQTVDHSTDSLLRQAQTVSHTTDSNKKKATIVSHTADSLLRKANVVSHTTSSNKKKSQTVSHTTDSKAHYVGSIFWVTPLNNAVGVNGAEPLVFEIPSSTVNTHFHLQIDTVNTFDSGDFVEFKSWEDQTNWEFWDGDSWEPVPSGGVDPSFAGNEARFIPSLANGDYYRRIRGRVVL